MLTISDLKRIGLVIKFNNEPYQVLKSQHARTAQRRAFVRTTLKNLISGKLIEKTFNQGDEIEEIELKKVKATFLYHQNNQYYFMNLENFEEVCFSETTISEEKNFLKEGLEVNLIYLEDKPITIELPVKLNFLVTEAPPAIKGDSAQTSTKQIILETGLKIEAPFFIEKGEIVVVNTRTKKYVERIK